MSQTWSYMRCFLYYQCHIPDTVLHRSSHIGVHAMSRHGLAGDLSSQCQRHVPDIVLHGISLPKCHDICIHYILNVSTGLLSLILCH
ncbi:hypothetical protein Gotur_029082, partial [Gossypium turneri]